MHAPNVPESVRNQLDKIVASQAFASSARSASLLKFVVQEAIDGNADQLKEYTLGAKGLGRGDAFDPRIDPIVRAEASRLRTRLTLYYGTEGLDDPLVISLPKGSYVPVFEPRKAHPADQVQTDSSELRWKMASAGLALALLIAAGWGWHATRPQERPLVRLEVELRFAGSLGATVGTDVAISPDATRLAFVAQDNGAIAHLYTLRLDEQQTTELEGTDGARGQFFSPDGQWILFQAQGKLKKVPAAGGPPVVLCDAADMFGGSWGDDDNIVATLDTTGKLWRIPSRGGERALIADIAPALPSWPQTLPGSKAVLFTNTQNGADGASIEVLSLTDGKRKTVARGGTYARYLPNGYLTYVNGGKLFAVRFDPIRQETRGSPAIVLDDVAYSSTFGYAHLAFSQNGTFVYRRSTSLLVTEWLDESGKTEPLLARPARYIRPRLSPDGRRLAYSTSEVTGTNSWIFDIAGKKTTHLEVGEGYYSQPIWTPDGRLLVLGGLRGMGWLQADGTGAVKRLWESDLIQVPISFTPDGSRLAYLEFSPVTGLDLWTMRIENSGGELHAERPEPFLVTPAFESQAMFSPDGRWIAYCSTESGSWEVYVQPFPRKDAKVQVSSGGGRIPFWSRNGRDLFYATERQQIMRVPYTIRNGAFAPGQPVPWTERRFADTGVIAGVDLAQDGKHFAALMPIEPAEQQQSPNHVTMVLNFFDEIQRRVP
jgi:Tol biopolymer transport system component